MSTGHVKQMSLVAFAFALLLVGPLSRSVPVSTGRLVWPDAPADCVEGTAQETWRPRYSGADETRTLAFVCNDALLVVHGALWRSQSPGHEAVSDGNRLLPEGWRFAVRSRDVDSSLGHSVAEHAVVLGSEAWLIWAWYMIGDVPAADALSAKTQEAMNAARFERFPAAQFTIAARAETLAAAQHSLATHATALRPELLLRSISE